MGNADFDIHTFTLKVKDYTLVSSLCAWCGSKGEMTRTHVVPKSLGGWFQPRIACAKCNNYLGTYAEAYVKKNAFLTAAIAKHDIQEKHEAFRQAKLIDPATSLEMRITKEGVVRPIQKILDDGSFVGTPEEIMEYNLRKFREDRPNWPTAPIEEFYADPTRTTLKYAGLVFKQKHFSGGLTEIALHGLSRDPHPYLLFKIVYEYLVCNGALSQEWCRDMLRDIFVINTQNDKERIVFDAGKLQARVISDVEVPFRGVRKLETIEFQRYHRFMLRLSRNGNLYFEIGLFDRIRSMFILGKNFVYNDWLTTLLNRAHFLALGQQAAQVVDYPNLRHKFHIIRIDAIVDLKANSNTIGK